MARSYGTGFLPPPAITELRWRFPVHRILSFVLFLLCFLPNRYRQQEEGECRISGSGTRWPGNTVAGKQGYSETGWLDGDIGRLDLGYKGPLGYTVIRTIKLYS